jgi:hypothetical protein
MNYLFLDIDGVLNNHKFDERAGSATLDYKNIKYLNAIIDKFAPQIVLTSAWRYMITRKEMTLTGFSYMLRTHRVSKNVNLIGTTDEDGRIDFNQSKAGIEHRRLQILRYIATNIEPQYYPNKYDKIVIIDDLPLGPIDLITKREKSIFVQTQSEVGLSKKEYQEIKEFYEQ